MYFWWNSMCSCLQRQLESLFLEPHFRGKTILAGTSKKGLKFLIPRHLANRFPQMSHTELQMRETNDVKYEFKFDHVLILASSSACARLSTNFQNTLPARKTKTSIDKTKSRLQNHEWNRVEQKPDLQPVVFASCANFLMTLQEQNAFHTVRTDISCGMSWDSSYHDCNFQQQIATLGQCHGAHDDGLGANQAGLPGLPTWPSRIFETNVYSSRHRFRASRTQKGDACDLEKGSKKGKETQIMSWIYYSLPRGCVFQTAKKPRFPRHLKIWSTKMLDSKQPHENLQFLRWVRDGNQPSIKCQLFDNFLTWTSSQKSGYPSNDDSYT